MLTFYSATRAVSGLTSVSADAQMKSAHCEHFQSFVHTCVRIFMHTLGPCTLIRGQLPQWPLFIWWSRYMKVLMRLDWGRSGSTEKRRSSISHLSFLLLHSPVNLFCEIQQGLTASLALPLPPEMGSVMQVPLIFTRRECDGRERGKEAEYGFHSWKSEYGK